MQRGFYKSSSYMFYPALDADNCCKSRCLALGQQLYMVSGCLTPYASCHRRTKAAKVEPAIELLASLYNQNKLAA